MSFFFDYNENLLRTSNHWFIENEFLLPKNCSTSLFNRFRRSDSTSFVERKLKKKNRLFVSQKNDSGVKQSFASSISCRFIHFDPIDWLHTDLKYSLVEIRTMSGFFFYWFRLLQIVFHITAPVEIERRINQPSTMSLCFVFFSFIYFELGQPAQRQTCGFANDEPAIKIIDSQKESFVFTNSLIKSLNYLQWIILFILSTQKTFLFS